MADTQPPPDPVSADPDEAFAAMFRAQTDVWADGLYQKEKAWFDAALAKAVTSEEMVTVTDGSQIKMLIHKPKNFDRKNSPAYFYAH